MRPKPRVRAKQQLLWSPTKLAIEFAKVHVVVAVVGWSRSMAVRGSFTLSSTIECDKLRRRPRRDSHGTCRLSGVHSPLLGQ